MPAHRTPYRTLWRAAAYGVAASLPVLALAWLVRTESGVVVDADRAAVAAATRFAGERPALERAVGPTTQVARDPRFTVTRSVRR